MSNNRDNKRNLPILRYKELPDIPEDQVVCDGCATRVDKVKINQRKKEKQYDYCDDCYSNFVK